ncbi:hypothetical protein A4X06_0g6282 [Tilletia controversa]|uniref:Uncharacterized protein n=1 Tax=Tilletia controversa TaxID=13291 RepID=A0A8X7MQ34_9BASI|nr:hypothetical protein CF328_g4381 [Tilletia controversa]KAE8243484.1 hypothetical protein A4X06_0g6282 [Tilletia controversa]
MGKPRLRSQSAHTHARSQPQPPPSPTTPAFTHKLEGPLLVLLFSSKQTQRDALSRIETFYEGAAAGSRYIGLQEAGTMGLCKNYMAFNCTVQAVRGWVGLMWEDVRRRREVMGGDAVEVAQSPEGRGEGEVDEKEERQEEVGKQEGEKEGEEVWWDAECSVQERHLLRLLTQLGCVSSQPPTFGPAPSPSSHPQQDQEQAQAPTYLISALTTNPSDLSHERLHALFHLSPTYAHASTSLFQNNLSPKVRAAIEWDLRARGYREEVWADEWQAYVSEDAGEFGGKARGECAALLGELRGLQRRAREELGLV